MIDNTDPLDRFTFMVKKSLSKIDPSFASGATSASGLSLDGFGNVVNTLVSGVYTLSGSVEKLQSDIEKLQARIDTLTAINEQAAALRNAQAPETTPSATVITETVTVPALSQHEKAIIDAFEG